MATIAERNVLIRFKTDSKKAQRDLKNVERDVKGLSGLATQAAATFAGIFAFDIAQSTIQGIAGLGRSAASLAINFEQTQVAFETFLGSTAKANKVLAELQEFSTLTPFEPEQVISAGQSLLAFGVNAEDLTSTLQKLGDISAGTGTDFNELAQIFGKAKVQGRLFAEDINQLTGRGIPIIQEFAKQFGVTDSEVKKLVETGKIGFPELEKAFTDLTSEGGKFFELTAKQSQTVAGRISTLTGNFNELLKSIGTALLPTIGALVDQFSRFVSIGRDLVELSVADEFEKQSLGLSSLTLELQDVNTSEERRLEIINQLKQDYPAFLADIDAETVSNEELIPTLEKINKLLVERIVLQRQEERVQQQRINAAIAQEEASFGLARAREALAPLQRAFGDQLDTNTTTIQEQAEALIKLAKESGGYRNEIFAANVALKNLEIQTGVQTEENEVLSEQTKILAEVQKATSEEAKSLGDSIEDTTEDVKTNTKAVVDNSKELKKQKKLIEDLAKLQEKNSLEVQKDAKRALEQTAKEDEEQAKLKQKQREEDLKNKKLALEAQEEFETSRREIVISSARQELDFQNQLDEQQAALKQEAREKRIKGEEEALNKIVAANQAAASALNDIGEALFGQQIKRLDEQIEAQRNVVDESLDNIERGGAEQVQLEERRLQELQDQRKRAADQLRVITAIEVAANQAAAVASGIAAVAAAFKPPEGGLAQGVITSVALAATIAGSVVALRNAFSDIPGFADGTEFFDGVGGPRSDSNLARLSRGERVVPADVNSTYFDTLNEFQNGTPMADLLHSIASGSIQLPMVSTDRQVEGVGSGNVVGQLEKMNKKLDKLDISVTMDKNGFAASISKYKEGKNRMRRKING